MNRGLQMKGGQLMLTLRPDPPDRVEFEGRLAAQRAYSILGAHSVPATSTLSGKHEGLPNLIAKITNGVADALHLTEEERGRFHRAVIDEVQLIKLSMSRCFDHCS